MSNKEERLKDKAERRLNEYKMHYKNLKEEMEAEKEDALSALRATLEEEAREKEANFQAIIATLRSDNDRISAENQQLNVKLDKLMQNVAFLTAQLVPSSKTLEVAPASTNKPPMKDLQNSQAKNKKRASENEFPLLSPPGPESQTESHLSFSSKKPRKTRSNSVISTEEMDFTQDVISPSAETPAAKTPKIPPITINGSHDWPSLNRKIISHGIKIQDAKKVYDGIKIFQ